MSRIYKEKNASQKLIVVISFSVIIFILFPLIYYKYNKLEILLNLYCGIDQPSKLGTMLKENIFQEMINNESAFYLYASNVIKKDEKPYLHGFLYYCLGINGNPDATQLLIDSFCKYQNNTDSYSIMFDLILALGIMGDRAALPKLTILYEKYDLYRNLPPKHLILISIYLITGHEYGYKVKVGGQPDVIMTDEIRNVRKTILFSKGRKRTLEEMIILDKITKPPEDWKE